MSLLDADGKQRVVDAIARAEASSSGEIVVAIIARSDDYAAVRAVVGLGAAVACGWCLYLEAPTLNSAWVFASQPIFWLLGWWGAAWPPVLRRLVSKQQQQQSVDRRCKWTFIHHGLTETRDRTGVLLLVSVAERQIQVLADKGIYERLGKDAWQREVDGVRAAVRAGKAADGLCAAVTSIGQTLATHFPRRSDDTDELPNSVLEL